jgi:hypothetical protein
MSWTDARIASLKSMWLDGYTATQIAEELGGVSRNAVIGKAHRLGLESRSSFDPMMLSKVVELPISKRTKRLIANDNIIFVGDLVQKSEVELLRMPDFGRKSLSEVRTALAAIGLRPGMWVVNWPPDDVEKASAQWEISRRVSELRQARGGAIFKPVGDHFAMATEGDEGDLAAALRPMTQQMQSALLQKARGFAGLAARLDNQAGWGGIRHTANMLAELLDRTSAEIPDVLGYLYPAAIELGSFVELDQQLAASVDSYAAPLDPEVRRPLSDLVRTLAPWLRTFPSVREADDEASRFLVQAAELKPTFDVVKAAGEHLLLTGADLEVFRQLHGAASRGAFQGEKAGGRAKRSASNFVIGVVAFAGTFFSGAVSADFATASPLVHKVGQFLVHTEKSIEALVADLPQDLRYSIAEFVKDLPNLPPALLPQSSDIIEPVRRSFRVRDRPSDKERSS